MKEIYKIIIACTITMILTAGATIFIMAHNEYNHLEIVCADNASPDINGCCPGEEYTDMGDQGFNCCPTDGSDCFPPIVK